MCAELATATFALDDAAVVEGRLVVRGRWAGVRGRRFVRPTLLVGGRREVLATLDHKPWPAQEGAEWVAAFPWDGGRVDLDELALAVAPSITVPLGRSTPPAPRAGGSSPDPDPDRTRRLEREVGFLRERLAEAADELADNEAAAEREETSRTAVQRVAAERDAAREAARRLAGERDLALAELERLSAAPGSATPPIPDEAVTRIVAERDAAREKADRLAGELRDARTEIARLAARAETARTARAVPAATPDVWLQRVLAVTAAVSFLLLLLGAVRVL